MSWSGAGTTDFYAQSIGERLILPVTNNRQENGEVVTSRISISWGGKGANNTPSTTVLVPPFPYKFRKFRVRNFVARTNSTGVGLSNIILLTSDTLRTNVADFFPVSGFRGVSILAVAIDSSALSGAVTYQQYDEFTHDLMGPPMQALNNLKLTVLMANGTPATLADGAFGVEFSCIIEFISLFPDDG
jgi:hypothetical protein